MSIHTILSHKMHESLSISCAYTERHNILFLHFFILNASVGAVEALEIGRPFPDSILQYFPYILNILIRVIDIIPNLLFFFSTQSYEK